MGGGDLKEGMQKNLGFGGVLGSGLGRTLIPRVNPLIQKKILEGKTIKRESRGEGIEWKGRGLNRLL